MDSGAGGTYVGESFLNKLQHTVESCDVKATGLGDVLVYCTQRAYIEIYLPGINKNGKRITVKITKDVLVVNNSV